MANIPMAMPATAPSPDQMAILDQIRQNAAPGQISNELLSGASQVDPQAVYKFKSELNKLQVPPEVLNILDRLLQEILSNPERYAEIRQAALEAGIPADILPERFDPSFFGALNMALDQLSGAGAGEKVQSFAKGGIAELKPIAKAIQSQGRNGDTILAHINPAEARMLKRMGGSGTINPATGLPEFGFFDNPLGAISDAISGIGKAVSDFAKSSVGRVVTTIALGMVLGPAAASFLGVSSPLALAAVSGFVGGAGSTLLAGGNIGDALRSGVLAGISAGVANWGMSQFMGPGAMAPGAEGAAPGAPAIPGAEAAPVVPPEYAGDPFGGASSVPSAPITPESVSNIQPTVFSPQDALKKAAPVAPPVQAAPAGSPNFPELTPAQELAQGQGLSPSMPQSPWEQAKQFGSDAWNKTKDMWSKISPSEIQAEGAAKAQQAGQTAADAAKAAGAPEWQQIRAYDAAVKSATPGILSTYGPAVGTGLGIMALSGGFDKKPVEPGQITKSLYKPAAQRIREEGTQRQNYIQGLPGVQYDQYGEPIAGSFTGSLPTYNTPTYGSLTPGVMQPSGIMQLPPIYTTPQGAMGSGKIAQPYNTALMYPNLLYPNYPNYSIQQYEDGGVVQKSAEQIAADQAAADKAAADKAAADALAAQQRQARDAVAQQKAMRRAQGYGTMYANINAGLGALAPEVNPINSYFQANPDVQAEYYRSNSPLTQSEFAKQHFTQWGQQEGRTSPGSYGDEQFGARNRAAQLAALNQAYAPMLQGQQSYLSGIANILKPATSVTTPATAFSTDKGIAALAQGGYPRMNGQISGPGTEKSDSIPAMLSDGEFVMTAKAVRGMGNGSRRDGAKKMYKLMHQLESNAQRA